MHPTSQIISSIIANDPSYDLQTLQNDLLPNAQEKPVSRKDVMDYFGVSERTVDNWLQRYPDTSFKTGNAASSPRRVYLGRLKKALAESNRSYHG